MRNTARNGDALEISAVVRSPGHRQSARQRRDFFFRLFFRREPTSFDVASEALVYGLFARRHLSHWQIGWE